MTSGRPEREPTPLTLSPKADPQRWRAARRHFQVAQAQDRLDPALGREFEGLPLGQRVELALSLARNVLGFALRDCIELQTRYSLAASYSETINHGAHAIADGVTSLLAEIEHALDACESLLALPESEWAKWSPPVVGQRPDDTAITEPSLPQTED